jgi:tetratricopeptide (TPR) repeat protein
MARSSRILSFSLSVILLTTAAVANDSGDCNQTADADRMMKGCINLLARAYFTRGMAHFNKREYDMAIGNLDRAIELNPNYGPAYSSRGYVYYYVMHEVDKAIADFNRAIELNPKDPDAYINRGMVYTAMGEYGRAITDYNRAIELNPKDELAYYIRGNAFKDKGEYGKAIADYNHAIELNPKNAITLRQLGAARFDAGDFKGASSELLRSLELKGDGYTMLYRYLARARAGETLAAAELEVNAGRLKTKEWPYAVIEFYLGKRSLELTLDSAAKLEEMCEAQFYIGEWHVLQNKPAEAQAALEKAIKTCPKIVSEYYSALAELKRLP